MGTWSEQNFGNDDANDWGYILIESKDIKVLIRPIDLVNSKNGYLESYECNEALAASEVILALLTKKWSRVPNSIEDWVNVESNFFSKKKIVKKHAGKAKLAVEKIVVDSELKDLWKESGQFTNWLNVQQELIDAFDSIQIS